MAQQKILIDTNSYLRLANRIHPLLANPFGEHKHCLYCIPELNTELESKRLTSKFHWIEEDTYYQNRKTFPVVGKKEKKQIKETYEFIWNYVQRTAPGPSKVDVLYIAYAIELGIPVVTDDQDMTELALLYEVEILSSIALLKLMFDSGYITMTTVGGLIDYWKYIGDRPANMRTDYSKFFPE